MRIKGIAWEIKASIKNWYRNKGSVFWTFAFPVLLILLFGEIFSGGNGGYTIYIQDMDDSFASQAFIDAMENISAVKVKIIGKDANVQEYAKEHAVLRIPEGFYNAIVSRQQCNFTLYIDPSQHQTNSVIISFISSIVDKMNLEMNNASVIVGYKIEEVVAKGFEYIDFFVPGIIGMTVMTSAIYGSIEVYVKYRKRGLLKKLLTTSFKRGEWIFAKMVYQLLINFFSAIVILAVGIAVFHLKASFNFTSVLIIIAASFAFTGIGMIIARFVNEEETADSAASAITFPMMFLAGTFFPLEIMPSFLQTIAKILPLYYVNEGLRNAMIYHDANAAMLNAVVIATFAIIVFGIGAVLTNWKEE